MQEQRTFYLVDDESENYFVGQFTRTQDQVKPEVWNLKPGDYLQSETPTRGIIRK